MRVDLTSLFSHFIEDKHFLGLDQSGEKISDRFSFFAAKKREADGRFYQLEDPQGLKVDARFYYMHDRATDDVYAFHSRAKLPNYFLYIAIGVIPVAAITIVLHLVRIIGETVQIIFEAFQKVYPENRPDLFLEYLKDKKVENFERFKDRILSVQVSFVSALIIEAAVIQALAHWKDENILFEMQVLVAHVEYLWNRKMSVRTSMWNELNRLNHTLKSKVKLGIDEIFFSINWTNFFSTVYLTQKFQSRGLLKEKVSVIENKKIFDRFGLVSTSIQSIETEALKFEVIPGTKKVSYTAFLQTHPFLESF